jgi:hypothetical protein
MTGHLSPPVSDTPRECLHPLNEVRWRLNSDGRRHYKRQCLTCGEAFGPMVATSSALADGRAPPQFDDELLARSRDTADRAYAERRAARARAFWDWYAGYLESDAWRAKRAQALNRDNGLCQGCRARPATQVHHLSYKHVGDELLFELASVCDECHARAHAEERR